MRSFSATLISPPSPFAPKPAPPTSIFARVTTRRALVSSSAAALISSIPSLLLPSSAAPSSPSSEFFNIPGSGGVKALDIRTGSGDTPAAGDQVAIHYYARLAAKQGWRFDSTYDHKDEMGGPVPFLFVIGSGKTWRLGALELELEPWSWSLSLEVISGIETAVKSMKVGGIRRVIIPPSQGYQNTSQEPLPPNFFDRQRLFTTIFNPTRLANGEGSTLGTLVFDIELVSLRHP